MVTPYNSVDDQEELAKLYESVERKVNVHHLHDVRKVTPDIVKEAAKNLKDRPNFQLQF